MKNKVNKQIIKALSVGLAASMALQPVAVYAEEGEPSADSSAEPVSVPASSLSEATPQDIEGGVADAAQSDAEVVSHPASQDPESKDKGGDLQVTGSDSDILTDDVANTAKAGEAGVIEETVKDEYGWPEYEYKDGKWVVKKEITKDYAQDVIDEADDVAKDTNIADAATDIDNVKKDLIIAENADRDENNFTNAASSVVNDIQTKTEDVEKEVNAAVEQAETLANNIKNASSIEDAQKSYDDLDQLVKDTSDSVDAYNKALYGDDGKGGLMARYAAAIRLLENAQNRYDAAVGAESTEEVTGSGAKGSVEAAAKKVADAEKEVQELKDAIDAAKTNIEKINKAALDIAQLQDEINKDAKEGLDVSDKQDKLFVKVMQSYYAEQMLPDNATGAKLSKEGDYFKVTYDVPVKGAFGVFYETYNMYFDYNTNEAGEFVMYPKTVGEVAVINRIANYEKYNNVKLTDEQKTAYYYVDDFNVKQYRLSVELGDSLVKVGDNYYIKFGDGWTLVNPVNESSAPTSTSDIRNVGGTKQAVSVDNKKVEYTIDSKGRLIETIKADVTTTTYQKFATALHDYVKGGYSDDVKNAEKNALLEDETITVAEIKNKESNETYYVVTGTYTPSFVIELDDSTGIVKRHDVNKHGGKDAVKNLAKNETVADILNGLEGYSVKSNNLTATIKSWLKNEGENIYITGSVVITKDGVEASQIKSDECTSKKAAEDNLLTKIDEALLSVKPGDASINCWDNKGFMWSEREWTKEVGFEVAGSEVSKQTESYKKLSYYIEYIKKIDEKTQKGQVVSQTATYNYARAYEVIQDILMNSEYALNVDQYEEIKQARELMTKYNRYLKEVKQVQNDIDATQDDIDELKGAINTLDQAHNAKTAGEVLAPTLGQLSVADYFKVTEEDIVEFFKVQKADEFKEAEPEAYERFIQERKDSLGEMSINNFVNFLDYLKQKAENKKEAIEVLLENLEEQRDASEKDLKDTIDRLTPSDDDTTTGGGGDDTTFIPGTGVVTPRVTPLVANEGEAVLGEVRKTSTRSSKKAATTSEAVSTDNGNNGNSEVAGAKKEETKTPVVEETKEIEETETALAATPELEEKGFAWWWLLVLAAIAGVSVEEYARRKKNKAKADNSTKVNK